MVVGATGGSGTRVVARILRRSGLFIGTELNASADAGGFGDYSDRWIDVHLSHLDDWRTESPDVLAELERIGGKALAELGYTDGVP